MTRLTRVSLLIAVTSTLLIHAPPAVAATEPRPHTHPTTYVVSEQPGVFPEGIEVTDDGTMYVTGVRNGAVYRGHVRSSRLEEFLPPGADGRASAAGVHVDRYGRIWVAGYSSSKLYVYAESGRLLAVRSVPSGSDLNDFAITRDAVYVTDSGRQTLWRASVRGRHVGQLEPWLSGDDFSPAADFLNGIVASPRGDVLLVADGGTEALHRVDVRTASARQVRIDGYTFPADGMLLRGRRLYGVVGFALPDGTVPYYLRELRLNRAWTGAEFVSDFGKADRRQTPTTIAFDGNRLLWVNSQLGNTTPAPPWTVTEVRRVR